jgi:hypothetical protein
MKSEMTCACCGRSFWLLWDRVTCRVCGCDYASSSFDMEARPDCETFSSDGEPSPAQA